MSSFFTLPPSQKKRKRSTQASVHVPKANAPSTRRGTKDDDSISGSDISGNETPPHKRKYESSEDESDEDEEEDAAAKRIRLAEQYLANTQKEVIDEGGFNAAEIDEENLRRRMSDRLKQDTAESKGKLYRWIGDDLDWKGAQRTTLKCHHVSKSITGVAVQGQHVYAVSKDIHLVKWELPSESLVPKGKRISEKAKLVASTRGKRKDAKVQHHHGAILCVAVSQDGKFVATGGSDKKLIVWDASTLRPLKVFTQHRDAVTALSFQRNTHQLFSASKDRTIKIWSLDELAYVETLFGHQDEVVDVDALAREICVSVGARDRTARYWKVVEEAQLVFRGGGAPSKSKSTQALRAAYADNTDPEITEEDSFNEGSIDRIAMIDDDTFVTASDNGSISLWNIQKKKAVFTLPLAHGLDPPLSLELASAEVNPDEDGPDEKGRGGKHPRWITALKAIPFSDSFLTGSWDGFIRVWKISKDKRKIEPLGAVGTGGGDVHATLTQEHEMLPNGIVATPHVGEAAKPIPLEGVVGDLAIIDQGDRGKEGILIAAAVGKEHRLGRWNVVPHAKNCVVLFRVREKRPDADRGEEGLDEAEGVQKSDIGFENFN